TYVPASVVQERVTRLGDATVESGSENNPDMSGGGNEDNASSLGGPIVDSDPDAGSNGELHYRSEYRSSVIASIDWRNHGVTSPLPGISAQCLANGRQATHASQTGSAAVESEMASSGREQIVGHGTGDIVDNGA